MQTRVFLVGCPRSGTTLLQSLLGANSRIASFPETHFFERLFPGHAWLKAMGVASRRAGPRWKAFLEVLGHPEMQAALPRPSLFVSQFSGAFVLVLDTLTLEQGKRVWIEKTPGHLRFVDQIAKVVNGARFVHIRRNGPDNIASLYETSQRYPEGWGPCYRTLDLCIQRWIVDTRLSEKCASQENHRLVSYENLVADPRATLVELSEFLGVPFEEEMLTRYPLTAAQVVLTKEPWKASVGEPIRARKSRFNELFDEQQRRYILGRIPEDLLGSEASERLLCGS